MAINLLPKDISKENKVSSRSRSLTYLTYILFIVGAVVMVGGALMITAQQRHLNSLKSKQQELLVEVEKYQQQEQQLIIIKDRLALVNEVLLSRSVEGARDLQKILYDSMPTGVRVSQQSVSEQDNEFIIHAESARILRDYIRELKQKEDFRNITISQLSFNPFFGYQVEFAVQ